MWYSEMAPAQIVRRCASVTLLGRIAKSDWCREKTQRYYHPPVRKEGLPTRCLLFPWRHRVALFTRSTRPARARRRPPVCPRNGPTLPGCTCCTFRTSRSLGSNLISRNLHTGSEFRAWSGAYPGPSHIMLPGSLARLIPRPPFLPGRQRIGRRRVIDWSVRFWEWKGGSPSSQSFRFSFETHHRARISLVRLQASARPTPRSQRSHSVGPYV
ncbi:hypothetical protein B0T14DRAFT_325490 [Immersiella caudata]|uniref:Uncharacterized protein n=1 Tax=Immersiella caudata TaxID=314043 RepID=A0AA39TL32_9PEZI|nr:hypothetical protein B0T14DRAFT_325490 [Immersiella caudata]